MAAPCPATSKNSALLRSRFGREKKPRLDRWLSASDKLRDILAHRWPMFEAMARAAAREPDVLDSGVAVENEIAARGVFVLADAAVDYRSVGQCREPLGDARTPSGSNTRAMRDGVSFSLFTERHSDH